MVLLCFFHSYPLVTQCNPGKAAAVFVQFRPLVTRCKPSGRPGGCSYGFFFFFCLFVLFFLFPFTSTCDSPRQCISRNRQSSHFITLRLNVLYIWEGT